jgi:chloramphenicol 3-O-phosphotransferase
VIGQSVPDWVSALGQVAGAVSTFTAVMVALWVARRDGRWRRAEQSDREAGQARLITAEVFKEKLF